MCSLVPPDSQCPSISRKPPFGGDRSARGSGAGAKPAVSKTRERTNRRMVASPPDAHVDRAAAVERGRPRPLAGDVGEGQPVPLQLVDAGEVPAHVRAADAVDV